MNSQAWYLKKKDNRVRIYNSKISSDLAAVFLVIGCGSYCWKINDGKKLLKYFLHILIKIDPMVLADTEFSAMVMAGSGIKINENNAIF